MSFQTGTNCELLYSNTLPGAAKASFTAEVQLNDSASMGTQPVIPGFFFAPNASSAGKTIRVVARGVLSTTGTPLFGFRIRLNTAINVITGPIILGTGATATAANGAATATSTASLQVWEASGDFNLVSPQEPTGANSNGIGLGTISGGAFSLPGSLWAAGTPASTAVVPIDIGQPYYLTVGAICSASSALNAIVLQQLFVYGLN